MNPKIAELESLIDQILQVLQETMQSGEVLSDEFQGMIAQELQITADQIQQLRQQESGQTQPPQKGREPYQGPTIPTVEEAPPSPDAQLLWILAGQNEDAFLNYLRQYPSPETQSLLTNSSELERVLEYLTAMMPPGEPPTVGGIKHSDLNSSNIWGTAYNSKTGKMKVRFQGGAEYEYDGVPSNIYNAFSKGQASAKTSGQNQYGRWWTNKNPSMGAAMNQYIKAGNFPYRRIN